MKAPGPGSVPVRPLPQRFHGKACRLDEDDQGKTDVEHVGKFDGKTWGN